MNLFKLRSRPLTPDENERAETERALRAMVEACQSRFTSIDSLKGSAGRDALVLSRELRQDLVAAFSRIDTFVRDTAIGGGGDSAVRTRARDARLRRVQELLEGADTSSGVVNEIVAELERSVAELSRAFRSVKGRFLETSADAAHRRLRAQVIGVFVLGAVVAIAIAVGGYAIKSSRDETRATQMAAFYNDGVTYTLAGEHAKAVNLYEQALEAGKHTGSPELANVYNNLGWSLSRLGRLSEALMAYEMALQLKPDFELAVNNLKATRRELETKQE